MPPVKNLIMVAVASGLVFLLIKLFVQSQEPDPDKPIVLPAMHKN